MITEIREVTGASIRKICEVLKLARSNFYHVKSGEFTQILHHKMQIEERVAAIFHAHQKRYGYRRIQKQITEEGVICSPRTLRKIMKMKGLKAIQPKNFIPKTSDGKANQPSPNLLENRPLPTQPNEVWTSDITYIPSQMGWLYLAIILDLFSRKIVGWKVAHHLRSQLVEEAFDDALKSRSKIQSAIFHSDRGSQYSSKAFREKLKQAGFTQSMSGKSNPYDNAWTESFFGTLKREFIQKNSFENLQQAQIKLFAYINGYYNTHRKHSQLDYLSPLEFENKRLSHQPKTPNTNIVLFHNGSEPQAQTNSSGLRAFQELAEPALSGSY